MPLACATRPAIPMSTAIVNRMNVAGFQNSTFTVLDRRAEAHALVRSKQGSTDLMNRPRHVSEDGTEALPRSRYICLHYPGGTVHLRQPVRGLDLVRSIRNAHMAVGKYAFVPAVRAVQLGDVLHDEVRLDSVAGDERQSLLK